MMIGPLRTDALVRGMIASLMSVLLLLGMASYANAQGAGANAGERLVSGVIAATSAAVKISYVQPDGQIVGRIAGVGDPVFLDDEISTGPGNRLQILLADQTVFSIGPNSALVIDNFVFDPTAGSSDLVASVKRGSFKFISGKIAKQGPDKMKLRLPNSTASIRGTSVAGTVGNDGGSSIVLLSGAISVASQATSAVADLVQPGWGVAVDPAGSVGAPEQFSAADIDDLLAVVEFAPAEESEEEDGGSAEASGETASTEDDEATEESSEVADGDDAQRSATAEGDASGEADGDLEPKPLVADATEVKEILAENGIELNDEDVAALIEGEALIAEGEFEELFSDGELSPEDLEKELTIRLEARLGDGEDSDGKASSLASLFVQGFGGDGEDGGVPGDLFGDETIELDFDENGFAAPSVSFETLFADRIGADKSDDFGGNDFFSGGGLDNLFAGQSSERSGRSSASNFAIAPDIPEVKLTVARYAITFDDLKVEDVQFLAAIEDTPVFDIPVAAESYDSRESINQIEQYKEVEKFSLGAFDGNFQRSLSSAEIGALMIKYLQDGGVPQWATVTNDGGYSIGNPAGAVAGTAYEGLVSAAYSGTATFSKSNIALGQGKITINTADGDQTWTSTSTGSGTAAYSVSMNYDTGRMSGTMSYSNLVMNGTSFADATGNVSSGGSLSPGRIDNIDLGQLQSQDATNTETADVYLSASIGSATDGRNVVDGRIGQFDMNFFVEGPGQYVTDDDGNYLDANGSVVGSQVQAAAVPILSVTDFSVAE